MTYAFKPIRAKKWFRKSPWLLASLLVHAVAVVVMLLVTDGHGYGRGPLGTADEETFSVTWIPGAGGGSSRELDTVVPGADSGDSLEVINPVQSQPATSQSSLIAVVETDPQVVFNTESADSHTLENINPGVVQTRRESTITPVSSKKSLTADTDAADDRPDSANDREGITGRRHGTQSGENGSSGGGHNYVKFFGIGASARRIVYVIDASESMRRHQAMDLAREELLHSLNELEPTAHFQVVFFDLKTHAMNVAGERPRLLRATFSNLRLAERFIKGIQPDAGTDRFAAVMHALSFDPDVIYLLTDADDPEMSAKDLWDIRRGNKPKSIIHVVEFGVGADLARDSFLKRLTVQNGGTHHYLDLMKAGR